MIDDDAEMLGVEIGQRQMADPALLAQVGEMLERVEIAPVIAIPPVELQQVEAIHPHPPQRDADRLLDHAPRHRAGLRHPFGEGLDLAEPVGAAALGEPAAELAD